MKAYPSYKESGYDWLGRIPVHWEILPLRRGIEFLTDFEANGSFEDIRNNVIIDSDDKYAWYVRATDLENRRLGFEKGNRTCNRETYEFLAKTKLFGGELLIAKRGEIGKVYLMPNLQTQATLAPNLYLVRLNQKLFPHFAYLWFQSSFGNPQLMIADKSTTIGALYKNDVRDCLCIFPPIPEQQAIARFLDCKTAQIDTLIEKKQRQIKLLQEMRDVLTQNAMRSSKAKSLKLGEVADWVKRPINRQDEEPYKPIGLYNRGRGIFHKPITKGRDLGDSDFFEIKEGDFVISGQFAWEGAVALAQQEEDGCIASHRYYSLRSKPDRSETAYLFSFFTTQLGDNLLNHHSRGAAGRNRPLNINTLLREKIPIPPLSMQKPIADLIEKEVVLKQNTQRLVEFLREYRMALISEAVTGKIDVRRYSK